MTFSQWMGLAALATSGCAATTSAVSRAPIDTAQVAVQRAVESGASQDDHAVPYLHAAREELANAERFATAGQGERSRSMAMRAQVDADLACTVTRASIAHHETQDVVRGAAARVVRDEEVAQ